MENTYKTICKKLERKIWDYMKKEWPDEYEIAISNDVDIDNPITFKDLIFELISGKNIYEIKGLGGLDSEPEEIIIEELNNVFGEEDDFFGRFDFQNSKERFMETDYYNQLPPEEKLKFEAA